MQEKYFPNQYKNESAKNFSPAVAPKTEFFSEEYRIK